LHDTIILIITHTSFTFIFTFSPRSADKSALTGEDDGSEDGKTVDSTSSAKAFFWQMPGILGPWLMAYIISFNENMSADQKWRFLLGFGYV